MLTGELVAFKSQPCLMYSVKLSIYNSKASRESLLELTVHGPFITNDLQIPSLGGLVLWLAQWPGRRVKADFLLLLLPGSQVCTAGPEQPHPPGQVLPCFSSLLSNHKVQLMEPCHLNTEMIIS